MKTLSLTGLALLATLASSGCDSTKTVLVGTDTPDTLRIDKARYEMVLEEGKKNGFDEETLDRYPIEIWDVAIFHPDIILPILAKEDLEPALVDGLRRKFGKYDYLSLIYSNDKATLETLVGYPEGFNYAGSSQNAQQLVFLGITGDQLSAYDHQFYRDPLGLKRMINAGITNAEAKAYQTQNPSVIAMCYESDLWRRPDVVSLLPYNHDQSEMEKLVHSIHPDYLLDIMRHAQNTLGWVEAIRLEPDEILEYRHLRPKDAVKRMKIDIEQKAAAKKHESIFNPAFDPNPGSPSGVY